MSELSRRIITASLLLPLVIWWLLFAPARWFEWILASLTVLAMIELVEMLNLPGNRWLFIVSSLLMPGMLLEGVHPLMILFTVSLVWTLGLLLSAEASHIAGQFGRLAMGQWMMLWLMVFMWGIMQIHAHANGQWFILGGCLGIWASDISAYFIGKRFGTHKLCPAISPGKTREGFLAALVFGTVVATGTWVYLLHTSLMLAVMMGIILVFIGVMGDLAESALKRAVGVKDSGRMLPGHGGLLDRIDALIPALPVVGLIWMSSL